MFLNRIKNQWNMFAKLRLRLTLTNVFVVSVIFIILFSSLYLSLSNNITKQSRQLIQLISYNIMANNGNGNIDVKLMKEYPYFIMTLDASQNITGTVGFPDKGVLPVSDLKLLVDKVMNAPRGTDLVKLNSNDIFRYNVLKKGINGLSMVFVNVQAENKLITSLRLNLIVASILGLILAFAGSLYMADRSLKPIKHAWEKQQNFTADASHELRTPLTVIQTNLELIMLHGKSSVESQFKWLDNIKEENKRMTRLVEDLLLLARADSNQKVIEKSEFKLNEAVADVVKPFEPIALQKNILLLTSLEEDIKFYGDVKRIKQLIVILLDNAIKYTPPQKEIQISAVKTQDTVEITVSDEGEGIDIEDLTKIFDRFYRIDKARSRNEGGAGLGLSIADWIVREHNGRIDVSSTPGVGSVFKVILPSDDEYRLM